MTVRTLAFSMLASVAMISTAAAADPELKINYNWTSPAEVASVKILQEALAKRGVKWTDFAVVAHDTGANISVINMIAGGNPPDVFLNGDPGLFTDLKKQNLRVSLTDYYKSTGAVANFPSAVMKSISVDGDIVKVPIAIQIDGMAYYNKEVAAKAGVDPTKWKSMDDVWADFDKVKAAGFIPLAIGGQKWQIQYLLHSLMATYEGATYEKVYTDHPKADVFSDPGLKRTFALLRKFQQHTDPGSPNRAWNDTTSLVITGKALMQIHGDWMKGEFRNAGKVLGKDYGCMAIPGATGFAVTVDNWGFIKSNKPEVTDAQLKFAGMSVDPTVAADFAAVKGATPAVLNAPTEKLDECNKIVLDVLKDPAKQHTNPHSATDEDWFAATGDVADRFWNTAGMTEDQAIEALKTAHASIF